MKKLTVLFFALLAFNNGIGQAYEGTVFYNNGHTQECKIEIPKTKLDKSIEVDGKQIESSKISRLVANINGTDYTFIYTNYGVFGPKEYKEFKTKVWYLKLNVLEGDRLEAFINSDKFKVDKKGKLQVIGIGDSPYFVYAVKKPEDKAVVFAGYDTAPNAPVWGEWKILMRMVEGYLGDCEKLQNIEKKEYTFIEICSIYNECE